jgi:putative ABC transport system permease protein
MKAYAGVKQAWRGVSTQKLRTFLMMLGIIIGVAALTIIVSVGQGAKAQVGRSVSKMFGANPIMITAGTVLPHNMPGGEAPKTLTYDDLHAMEQEVPNVRQVSPELRMPDTPLKYRERTTDAMVFGITPPFRDYRGWDVESGEFLTEEEVNGMARVCLLGQTTATDLFGEADPVGQTIRIENVGFKVKGVLAPKGASPFGAIWTTA